ncbi:MAG: UDP-glucose--hexose-1-phosphate uridylyltransferase, partial [Melioribacteraceae bacterium]|nr:UDP-glucose--hexose-1-phosphate uridylyltransferase [Melioribacteraceae bacterium]
GEWVLVSPHRTKRPWQGKTEDAVIEKRLRYDQNCYLCPGNERAGGKVNPEYKNTFVFTNDFAALLPGTAEESFSEDELFTSESVKGTCRVMCFSPKHDLTLPELEMDEIEDVIDLWIDQYDELSKDYLWVQIFENKGEIMGCSNPHPHGQIWASNKLPNEAVKEDNYQKKYYAEKGSVLLIDYLASEIKKSERIIVENDDWVVLVPYWATWPFETLLLPKMKKKNLLELNTKEKRSLAEILKLHLIKYDNLFSTSFPYTMGWHNSPNDGNENKHWQLHAHFYPPLLRSATVKKFMVGYEMLSEAQRDFTPEQAAQKLIEQSEIHYKTKID